MNGEPLPKAHGFPARLLVPGLFGMKNPKWITRLEVVDYDFQGYWEKSGWSDEAVVKTMSKATTLKRTHPLGEIPVGGGGHARGEYSVKVRAKDGGGVLQIAKQTATLPDGASGYHTLRVRVRK